MKSIVVFIVIIIVFPVVAFCSENHLMKEDVALLARQGLSEDEIVWKLEKNKSNFQLTDKDRIWLEQQGVSSWVCMVMDMKPEERTEKLPIYYGGSLSKKNVVALTKKGIPAHELCLMIANTHSKYDLTKEDKKWLTSEGVNPLVIMVMETQKKQPAAEKPFLERGPIDRGGTPFRGGKYYDDAVPIVPGSYKLDHQLKRGEYDYFKIKLKNGQKLICSVHTSEISAAGCIAIHSPDRTELAKVWTRRFNEKRACSYEVFNASGDNEYYVLIGFEEEPLNDKVIYTIALEDHFDANTKRDAPAEFERAVILQPGEYTENWAALNDSDMYVIDIDKGEGLSLRLIPYQANGKFKVTFFNEDRERLAENRNKEPGSVVKVAMDSNDTKQRIYIYVERDGLTLSDHYGKYTLKIETIKQ